jgi:hypothetical protein
MRILIAAAGWPASAQPSCWDAQGMTSSGWTVIRSSASATGRNRCSTSARASHTFFNRTYSGRGVVPSSRKRSPDVYQSLLEAGAFGLRLHRNIPGETQPADEQPIYLGVRRALIEMGIASSGDARAFHPDSWWRAHHWAARSARAAARGDRSSHQ